MKNSVIIYSLSRWRKVGWSPQKHFWNFTAEQRCSILLNYWSRSKIRMEEMSFQVNLGSQGFLWLGLCYISCMEPFLQYVCVCCFFFPVGLSAGLQKNFKTDFLKTWMKDASQPRIDPINFWCWSGYIFFLPLKRCEIVGFSTFFVDFSGNDAWILIKKKKTGILKWLLFLVSYQFDVEPNKNPDLEDFYIFHFFDIGIHVIALQRTEVWALLSVLHHVTLHFVCLKGYSNTVFLFCGQ